MERKPLLQVPGEMFALAMEARQRDAGVVGSTQNILDFIALKLNEALEKPFAERLQVGVDSWLEVWQQCSIFASCQVFRSNTQGPCPGMQAVGDTPALCCAVLCCAVFWLSLLALPREH